jgi:hypothetical protein
VKCLEVKPSILSQRTTFESAELKSEVKTVLLDLFYLVVSLNPVFMAKREREEGERGWRWGRGERDREGDGLTAEFGRYLLTGYS